MNVLLSLFQLWPLLRYCMIFVGCISKLEPKALIWVKNILNLQTSMLNSLFQLLELNSTSREAFYQAQGMLH